MNTIKVTLSTGEVLEKRAPVGDVLDLCSAVRDEKPCMIEWDRRKSIGSMRLMFVNTAHIVKIEEVWS